MIFDNYVYGQFWYDYQIWETTVIKKSKWQVRKQVKLKRKPQISPMKQNCRECTWAAERRADDKQNAKSGSPWGCS